MQKLGIHDLGAWQYIPLPIDGWHERNDTAETRFAGNLYVVPGGGREHNFPVGGTDWRLPWGLLSSEVLNEV